MESNLQLNDADNEEEARRQWNSVVHWWDQTAQWWWRSCGSRDMMVMKLGVSRGIASWRDADGAKLADHVFYGDIWDDTGRFHKLFNFLCFVLLDCISKPAGLVYAGVAAWWFQCSVTRSAKHGLLLLSRRKVKRRGIIRLHYPTKPTFRLPKEVGNRV